MCNAGIMAQPPSLTKDGYEVQFGTNHLGHALLIRRCLPLLQRTAEESSDARIVILSSLAFRGHPHGGIVFSDLKTVQHFTACALGPWIRYGQSARQSPVRARARPAVPRHHLCVHPPRCGEHGAGGEPDPGEPGVYLCDEYWSVDDAGGGCV